MDDPPHGAGAVVPSACDRGANECGTEEGALVEGAHGGYGERTREGGDGVWNPPWIDIKRFTCWAQHWKGVAGAPLDLFIIIANQCRPIIVSLI